MAKLTEEQLLQQNAELQAQLKERDDKIQAQQVDIEKMEAQLSGKKHVDLSGQIPFKASWQTPQGKKETRTVKFKNPKVRLPDGGASVVSTVALSKLAAGKELSENELKESPGLGKMTTEQAAELLTKWAKIGAGVLVDA